MSSHAPLDRRSPPPYTQCISEESAVRTKIQKWGNSLGLRIPRSLAEEAGVEAGSEVDLSMRRGELVVKPARRRTYRLTELLRRITSKNTHAEVDAGAPVGREGW
jgi:antitoxin MazE